MAVSHRSHVLLWTVAMAVPAATFLWIHHQTRELCDHVQRVAGVPARIGTIDADLTGQIRLSTVTLGTQFSASAIEASIAARSFVTGQVGVDDIRVASPRVTITIGRNGDSDVASLVRRLGRASNRPRTSTRLRRISVRSGAFIARVSGVGEMTATDVELVPNATGVRAITGPVRVRTEGTSLRGELDLSRSAADIALPHATLGRVVAVAGRGSLIANGHHIAMHDVVVGRLGSGSTELRATIDDAGIPRTISASIGSALSPAHRTWAITLRGTRIPLRPFAPLVPRAIAVGNAHASGVVAVRTDGADPSGVHIDVDGTFDRVSLDHRAISPHPIAVEGSVRGAVAWSADHVSAEQLQIGIGESRWTISGQWNRRHPLSGHLDVALAPAPCSALFRSLPVEIRSGLDGLAMTGSFGGRVRLAVDLGAAVGEGVSLATDIANRCVVTAEATAADPGALTGEFEHVFADGSQARIGPGAPTWTDLQRLPGHVVAAFVSAEDARFYDHRGFDPVQIGRSLEIDLRDRQLTRGGSTISQQLVKNAFLTHRRSLDRKIQEAIVTWRLEAKLRKSQILERYLNVIELGPHVFGLHAAAQHWFGKSPHELGVRQGAFLAALTSEPRSMSRRMRLASGLDPSSAARVDTILAAMFRDGAIDRTTLDLARKARLSLSPKALAQP